MRSGQIASVGTKAHGLGFLGRRAQNPRPVGPRPSKIVRARLKNGVAGLVAGPDPHDTTTPETTMRLFWKLWINTARSMLSVAGAR